MIPPRVSTGCAGPMILTMDSVIADNHPVLANEHVVEVDVNAGHLDVGDVVDVELVVGMSNQGTRDSCVL